MSAMQGCLSKSQRNEGMYEAARARYHVCLLRALWVLREIEAAHATWKDIVVDTRRCQVRWTLWTSKTNTAAKSCVRKWGVNAPKLEWRCVHITSCLHTLRRSPRSSVSPRSSGDQVG